MLQKKYASRGRDGVQRFTSVSGDSHMLYREGMGCVEVQNTAHKRGCAHAPTNYTNNYFLKQQELTL